MNSVLLRLEEVYSALLAGIGVNGGSAEAGFQRRVKRRRMTRKKGEGGVVDLSSVIKMFRGPLFTALPCKAVMNDN